MSIKFKSLNPAALPDGFDAEVHTEEPIITVDEEEGKIAVSCIFPGFIQSDATEAVIPRDDGEELKMSFVEVGIKGAGYVSESGKPLMPAFRRFVQIPPGFKVEKVTTKKGKPVNFGDVVVTPAQENALDGKEDHEFEFDENAYGRDDLFPKDLVVTNPAGNVDGYNTLLVEIRPLQCNPAKKELVGYGNVTVTIRLAEEDEKDEGDKEGDGFDFGPDLDREAFGNLFLNPRRSPIARRPIKPIGPLVPFFLTEFIIIHHGDFKAAAEKLAAWKMMKGIGTITVDINKVGNTVDKIKKYIRDRRKGWLSRLRYVLLFGDTNHIVPEPASVTTDYYYATPSDPSGGSDCVAPWIAIGRIPVQTQQEAKTVVEQIIRYEKNPPCDPAYYDRMTTAAYFQDDEPDGTANRAYMKTMESIRDHLVSIGKDVQRVYVSNNPNPQFFKDGTPVPAEVKAAIVDGDTATDMLISETAEGELLMGHRDHGGTDGWSHPPFKTDHLDAITSAYPSIFYSINCLTGRFDANPTDSFAEAVLKLNGGAPSLIAATNLSGTWRNDSFMKALFDAIFPGVIPTYPGTTASYGIKCQRLGDILNYAKVYLLVAHGANSGVKNHFELYHVIGDPTLEVWGDLPLIANLGAYVSRGRLIIRLSSSPKGGVVTIWERGKLLKTIRTASRLVTVPLKELTFGSTRLPFRRRTIYVRFKACGYRFEERKVSIPFLVGPVIGPPRRTP